MRRFRLPGAALLAASLTGAGAWAGCAVPAPARGVLPAAPDAVAGHVVLENRSTVPGIVEVELTAAPVRLSLLPGTETDVYAYNGRVPGPLLEVSEGDSVVIHFRNELPEETTVHWHGLKIPWSSDGSPFHPVGPGGSYTYAFRVLPGTAGTYWYHPHPHHRSAFQVAKGLYGAIIVRDPEDPLPSDLPERVLMLADNRFRDDGSLDFPEPGSRQLRVDERNGREGDVLFVNGRIRPTLTIRPGEVQRWRIVNASAARIYRISLEGHTLLHVGSDGGLFGHPVEVDEIVLANGERVEVLVRGGGEAGDRASLMSLPYDRYMPQWRPADWEEPQELLALQYLGDAIPGPTDIPETLRTVPPLDPGVATGTRVMRLSQGLINSRAMDLGRVDEITELGALEIWEVRNLVGMDHPIHLHGVQFQVLDRGGEAEPPRWKDTVNVPKFGSVRLLIPFDAFPGRWMFHCHNLTHEDQGMMRVLEVRERGSPARP